MIRSASTFHAATGTATIPADYTIAPLTVEQYHAMARAGILEEGVPIELLEGYLVEKMPKHPPHRVATQLVELALRQVIPADFHTAMQEPVTLEDSEPEPDVSVVLGTFRDYAERHPSAHEAPLVVEIADATLERDRYSKKRIYARAGIPCFWIVNLADRIVEVYSAPTGQAVHPNYLHQRSYGENESVPVEIEGRRIGVIPVKSILP